MIRSIVGFHQDSTGDWVAELSCYHNQHVRHRPPFQERGWVLSPDGRAAHLGSPIGCSLCDRTEFPEGLTIVGRAGPFDQDTLPAGLLAAHRTAEGRWGCLRVHHGAVDFEFESDSSPPVAPLHLAAGSHQPIPPGAAHHLTLTGLVRLELEFWGRSTQKERGQLTDLGRIGDRAGTKACLTPGIAQGGGVMPDQPV